MNFERAFAAQVDRAMRQLAGREEEAATVVAVHLAAEYGERGVSEPPEIYALHHGAMLPTTFQLRERRAR